MVLHGRTVYHIMNFETFGQSREYMVLSRKLLGVPQHVLLCGPKGSTKSGERRG